MTFFIPAQLPRSDRSGAARLGRHHDGLRLHGARRRLRGSLQAEESADHPCRGARADGGAQEGAHPQDLRAGCGVRSRWQEVHGRPPSEDDVDAMFADFVPLQLGCLSQYSKLIPGALDAVAELRGRGIRIGSTTGYLTEMMKINRDDAKRQGYEPDSTVCASDVPAGRPYPYMCLQNAINLNVTTVHACVKVE